MPSTTTKKRVWTVFVAYVAALGAMSTAGVAVLLLGLVIALWSRDLSGPPDPSELDALIIGTSTQPLFVLVSAGISALALGGAALVAARLSPTAAVERLRLGPARGGKWRFAVAPLAAVAALASGSSVLSILSLLGAQKSDALAALDGAVRSTGPMLVLAFVTIAIAAPLGEEMFFRGYAQTRLTARYGRVVGPLIATGLFALLHFDPMHIAVAFAIGVVLAWTTERTGSIRAAIFAHVTNNGLFVLAARSAHAPASWTTTINLGVAAALALAGIALLTRAPTRELAKN